MNNTPHPLHAVFLRILEDWAMMLVDPCDGNTQIFELDQPLFMSHVKMSGAFNGSISIFAQKGFLMGLAQNLLGSDSLHLEDEEQLNDAFREMGNVLAGNFITEAYGPDVAFDILQPNVRAVTKNELEQSTKTKQSYFFLADDAPICATFNIEE